MKNEKVEKILGLDRKIDKIILKGTAYYSPNESQFLNEYDREIISCYDAILRLIIELSKDDNEKNIEILDKRYFTEENTASQMIESHILMLQFYRNIDGNIAEKEIEVLNKIQQNLKLDESFEFSNKIELADCHFQIENEYKARKIILDLIKENPDEDERYQCMQNWYMYAHSDMDRLAQVIDLAEKNNYILITDFGYDRLVKYYHSNGDKEKEEKYKKFYDEWKKKRENY